MNISRRKEIVNRSLILSFSVPIIAFIGASISIVISGGWSIADNSIRDLGRLGSESAIVFNSSLIATGMVGLLNSLRFYLKVSKNYERIAMSFLLSAFIFLSLIGIFPTGTRLHSSICIGFILSAFLSITLFAIFSMRKDRVLAVCTTVILLFCSISGFLGFLQILRFTIAELGMISGFFIWYCLLAIFLSK